MNQRISSLLSIVQRKVDVRQLLLLRLVLLRNLYRIIYVFVIVNTLYFAFAKAAAIKLSEAFLMSS